MIFNTAGTAAGIDAEITVDGNAARVFVVPGVPKEMKIMFARDVFPVVREIGGGAVILSRTLHTFGLGESTIAEDVSEAADGSETVIHRLARPWRMDSCRCASIADSIRLTSPLMRWSRTVHECKSALGDLIFSSDGQTLPQVVGQWYWRRTNWLASIARRW